MALIVGSGMEEVRCLVVVWLGAARLGSARLELALEIRFGKWGGVRNHLKNISVEVLRF